MSDAKFNALANAVSDKHYRPPVEDIDVWYRALNEASQKDVWDDLISLIVASMNEIERLKSRVGHSDSR